LKSNPGDPTLIELRNRAQAALAQFEGADIGTDQ